MYEKVDTIVIGAGVIGASVARSLRRHTKEVFVLEAEKQFGTGISSRNSGVIHAGLYYPKNSLKEKLCRVGNEMLYSYAKKMHIPFERTGKYIIANTDEESRSLDWLAENVAGSVALESVKKMPNGIRAERALFSPNSGIIDVHSLILSLLNDANCPVLFQQKVLEVIPLNQGTHLKLENGECYLAERVINCCGLQATKFTTMYNTWFAKGSYFQLRSDQNLPHLVYPAVPKKSPYLGVHLTKHLHGEILLGPDFEWVEDENLGVDESRKLLTFNSALRFLPWLKIDQLQPAFSGIRPKLSKTEFSDFTFINEGQGLIHCLGIESPGITAALAIGNHVANLLFPK